MFLSGCELPSWQLVHYSPFIASSNAGDSYKAYSYEDGMRGGDLIGTASYNYGSRSRGVYFETNAEAYAFLERAAERGMTVTYSSNTTGGRCGEKGNPPCKSKHLSLGATFDPIFQPLIDSVEHQVSDTVLWSKLKSVVVIDEVHVQPPGSTEATLVGTAAYVYLETGCVVHEVGHVFPTLLEAQIYLDNRASSGAVVVYAVP